MARLLPLILLFLGACSFLPLRPTINLLDALPGPSSGSVTLDTSATTLDLLPLLSSPEGSFRETLPVGGASVPLSLTLPNEAGQPLDLRAEPLPVTLQAATLNYALNLASENLTGDLEVQPYLAPSGGGSIVQPDYALGEPQRVTLGGANTFQADVALNDAQLAGINDRGLRLALRVSGSAGVASAGEVALSYEFSALVLDVGALGASTNTRLPDADGEAFDFSEAQVPGPGRLIGADLDYALTLSHDADSSGTLIAQVYVAPLGTDVLWQEAYLFDTVEIDLQQREVNLASRASLNDAQRPLLNEKRLRFGVRVTGDGEVTLGEPVSILYDIEQLDLTVSYAL